MSITIKTLIHSDSNGYYKAKDIMSQLQKADLGIEFPDKPLSEVSLSELKCEDLPCTYSFSEGTKWNKDLRDYTARKLTLCFG